MKQKRHLRTFWSEAQSLAYPTLWGGSAKEAPTDCKVKCKEDCHPAPSCILPQTVKVTAKATNLERAFSDQLAEYGITVADVIEYSAADVEELLKDVLKYNVIERHKLKAYLLEQTTLQSHGMATCVE